VHVDPCVGHSSVDAALASLKIDNAIEINGKITNPSPTWFLETEHYFASPRVADLSRANDHLWDHSSMCGALRSNSFLLYF